MAAWRAVLLGSGPAADPGHRQHQGAAGIDEGLIGVGEGVAERFRRRHVGTDRALHVATLHQVVLESQVDDAVGLGRGLLQPVKVVERPSPHLGADRLELRGGVLGAGEADDLVARLEQLGDGWGADVAGRAGDEYAHGEPPSSMVDIRPDAAMSLCAIRLAPP